MTMEREGVAQPPMPDLVGRARQGGRLAKRLGLWLAGVIAVAALAIALGPRNRFGPDEPAARAAPPTDIQQLDAWLARGEARYPDLRPGTAKGIVWYGQPGQRTPWAVVYLHGFTASRLETAPLAQQIGQRLGANVFNTRLTGHGRSGQAMGEASAQDWLADAVEAVRIGAEIGDKVLVLGVSTGGTLGVWLASHPQGQGVSAYAFVSPNFGPKDKRSELINGPWGKQLTYALEGTTRGEPSQDPRENVAWTERYATHALFPMMALVKHEREHDLSAFRSPVLILYSERDQTVDPEETKAAFARIGSSNKTLEAVDYSEAQGQHVLAGDIRAPKATPRMADRIAAWVQGLPH